MANGVLIGLRVGQLVSLIIACATVAAGATLCHWVNYSKQCMQYRNIHMSHWHTYRSRMGGQYFVFVVSVIFMLVSIGLLIIECAIKSYSKLMVILIAAFSGLVVLISAVVEACYASGVIISWTQYFPHMKIVFGESTLSWIAAAAFLFLAMIFYFADAVLTGVMAFSKKSSYSPKHQPKEQHI